MRILLSSFLLLMASSGLKAQTEQSDSILRTLKEELNYSMVQLKQKPVPAYFMSLRMQDSQTLSISSVFGSASVNDNHSRFIVPNIRIGSKELDNYKFENQGIEQANNRGAQGDGVAISGGPLRQYRDEIWHASMNRYRTAVKRYEEAVAKSRTDAQFEDKSPCFSDAPVESYYEVALSPWVVDTLAWKNKLNRVSSVFKECRMLEEGSANIEFGTIRTYIVNSDGTSVVQNRRSVRIMLQAMVLATDGMQCPLYEDFFGFSEAELPSEEVLVAKAHDIVNRLLALRDAPLADPYAGPAILSGSASGVFFHEIFGHRLESHRMKKGGETFKHMVGERILPASFSVYCDPTQNYYGKQALNGSYKYDDEGVKARRVQNVENGVLKDFLTCRIPIDGFPVSNGHGRASGGNDPVSRQSNLVVQTNQPYTEAQLREMLIKEAKKQGKEYGYFFRTVTSGFTFLDNINAFNVTPVEVFRIYVDGRKDELVRGVNLIGTPLAMFSNITAAGDTPSTFTGSCGAESGWVPISATSPYIYVSKVETQRSNVQKVVAPALKLPEYTKTYGRESGKDTGEIIFKAMEDEMKRTKDSLHLANLPLPYFVDYRFIHGNIANVSASLGGVHRVDYYKSQNSGCINLSLGDKMTTSKMTVGNIDMSIGFPNETDYDMIRRGFWIISDRNYKMALNNMGAKTSMRKVNPLPEEDLQIPEMLELPEREYIEESAVTPIDTALMKRYAAELSAIFADYPRIFDSDVNFNVETKDIYRVTSEGQKLRFARPEIKLNINGNITTSDGSTLYDQFEVVARRIDELPSLDELRQRTREFCELFMKKADAPVVKEFYVGPIMIEDESVVEAISHQVVQTSCIASRDMQKGSAVSSMMLGKRIIDTKMSISQWADTPEYKGQKLLANYKVDVDGVAPKKSLPIIENGILKTLLTGRHPAIGAMESTGNERFQFCSPVSKCTPGIIHVGIDKCVPQASMKRIFLKEAKKAGLDHAYIVKAPKDCWKYLVRVDVNTGKEEIVRVSEIPNPSRSDFMHVTAASKEEFVSNHSHYDYNTVISYIVPRSIIVESIEHSFQKPNRQEGFQLQNPAERK